MPLGTRAVVAFNSGRAMFSRSVRNGAWSVVPLVAVFVAVARPALGQQPAMMMVPDPLGVWMDRRGWGTTWSGEAAPLPSGHYMAGQWDLMLHGFVFLQENRQAGPRGSSQFGSLNWGMFMASHELAGGRFQVRTMLSLDPATVTPGGYPLLLQSGGTYRGSGLHDRQHPHDFLMELAALYERPVTSSAGIAPYGSPSGEPARGPFVFMHGPSAWHLP